MLGFSGLYRRTQLEDDRDLRSRAPTERAGNVPRLQLMEDVAPFVLNGKTINDSPARAGRVYALSSGMMTPKTLSNIFARRVVENPQHSIFFVGYADPESPAGILRTAQAGDSVSLDPDEPAQPVRCQIEQFQFSAHASRESLVALREETRAEENSCSCMAIRRRWNGCARTIVRTIAEFRCDRPHAGRGLRICDRHSGQDRDEDRLLEHQLTAQAPAPSA